MRRASGLAKIRPSPRSLVGLDLGEHVAGMDLVALLLEPFGKITFGHRRRQRRHQDFDRHEIRLLFRLL
jgi:hypothetical protein